MLNARLLFAAILVMAVSSAVVRAEQADKALPSSSNLAILLDTIRANRKALVAANLTLSQEEAARFWPLYDRYQQQMKPVGERQAALIQEYLAHFSDLSNDRALQLVGDYLTNEADRIKVRREFIDEAAKVLPGRTVGRLFQIENKMDAVVRYELAARIPVIDETPATGQK